MISISIVICKNFQVQHENLPPLPRGSINTQTEKRRKLSKRLILFWDDKIILNYHNKKLVPFLLISFWKRYEPPNYLHFVSFPIILEILCLVQYERKRVRMIMYKSPLWQFNSRDKYQSLMRINTLLLIIIIKKPVVTIFW